jgi:hypothetical protein
MERRRLRRNHSEIERVKRFLEGFWECKDFAFAVYNVGRGFPDPRQLRFGVRVHPEGIHPEGHPEPTCEASFTSPPLFLSNQTDLIAIPDFLSFLLRFR